jgi:NAD(P)-dependent dehydrogenase (short-subunit alcohol dehydrogenase family)
MIDAVSRAEAVVSRARVAAVTPQALEPAERRIRQRRLLPILRGALARAAGGAPFLVSARDESDVLELCDREDAATVTQLGPMTPDHVIRTKPVPLWLGDLPNEPFGARTRIEAELSRYAACYTAYFDEQAARSSVPLTRLDALPRIVLVKGLGAFAIGKTLEDARVAGDVYVHTARVIADAEAIGRYSPVSRADLFDMEYWSLEQAKLKVGKVAGGPLARRIAIVTGAARGIGLATAAHLLDLGAHVMISDANVPGVEGALAGLVKRAGKRVAACTADVTRPEDCARLVATAVDTFGGLDVVVSNAGNAPSGVLHTDAGDAALRASLELNLLGHQNVARAATEVFLHQGIGGCLLFNASKSAFNPGKEFGPYAVPKAAVIALMKQYAIDLGAHGIRSNAVNADRIRTALFDGIVEARAKARGVSPDEYFRDNLLHRETTEEDVAEAFGYLAIAEATTGSVVTVDGGNPGAFPR